ncbi:hypothetical protein D3C85_1060780 [compost metagenome]
MGVACQYEGIIHSRYNPFDYITGQSRVEFQEHKEQKEEDDSQGDDIDKSLK